MPFDRCFSVEVWRQNSVLIGSTLSLILLGKWKLCLTAEALINQLVTIFSAVGLLRRDLD